MKTEVCPICEDGRLFDLVGENTVEYRGEQAVLESYYSMCTACGSAQANAHQVRENKKLMVAFKQNVDRRLRALHTDPELKPFHYAGASDIPKGDPWGHPYTDLEFLTECGNGWLLVKPRELDWNVLTGGQITRSTTVYAEEGEYDAWVYATTSTLEEGATYVEYRGRDSELQAKIYGLIFR